MADKSYGGMHGMHSGGGIHGQGLQINVVGCRNLTDKEWFSRQDPYVIIQYGTNKFRTRTDRDGGKNPRFNEKFTIPLVEGLREVDVQVWNSNNVALDDYIGTARVLLDRVLSSGYDDTPWALKSKSGKTAGEVNLILHYDAVKKADKHAYGAGYPAGQGGGYSSSGYPTGYPSSHSHAPASGYPQPVPYGTTGYAPAPSSGYPSVAQQSYQAGAPSPYSHSPSSHQGAPYPAQGYPAQGYPPAGYNPAPAPGHGSASYSSSHQYPPPFGGSGAGQPPAGYPPGTSPYGAPPGSNYDHRY